jgi:hypothetical protein
MTRKQKRDTLINIRYELKMAEALAYDIGRADISAETTLSLIQRITKALELAQEMNKVNPPEPTHV